MNAGISEMAWLWRSTSLSMPDRSHSTASRPRFFCWARWLAGISFWRTAVNAGVRLGPANG